MVEAASLTWSPQIFTKIDRILEFSPRELTHPVGKWVDKRLSMRLVNSEIPFMILRILEEIGEIEEAMMLGRDGDKEHAKELIDLLFFLFSLAHNLGQLEDIHLPSLANRLNGFGSHDNALDKMREVAGNMGDQHSAMKDINWLVSACMSYWRHGPIDFDLAEIMGVVLDKNGGNHPDIFYSGRDPYTGEILNPDEMYAQYIWSRFVLRWLRMMTGNQPQGLSPSDYLPFKSIINNFREVPQALNALRANTSVPPEIYEHLIGYYQHATEVDHITSWHNYARMHAQSPAELGILLPQPGLRRSSRIYH